MIREVTPAEALAQPHLRWFDVRSPQEVQESPVPLAHHVPLFKDEERAAVGLTYARQGQEAAIQKGVEIVAPKIPAIIQTIQSSLKPHEEPLIFCWRGGMRSKAVATFLDLVGIRVWRLEGGYRAYRKLVVQFLEDPSSYPHFLVLHGMTGVGKTMLIQRLQEDGYPVIDLEDLAQHRGSAFGTIGNLQPRNQRAFDAFLFHALRSLSGAPLCIIEGEGKRIGKVTIPNAMMEAKIHGTHLLLHASTPVRVQRILQMYTQAATDMEHFHAEVKQAISRIEKKLTPTVRAELYEALDKRSYPNVVELCLRHYYDPRYQHSIKKYSDSFHPVSADDFDQALQTIKDIYLQYASTPVTT